MRLHTDRHTHTLTHAVLWYRSCFTHISTRIRSPEGCRRLQGATEPWNELEREAGTRERAGTRNWNEDQNWNELERGSGTRPRLERGLLERAYPGFWISWNESERAGTRPVPDKLERERGLDSAIWIAFILAPALFQGTRTRTMKG